MSGANRKFGSQKFGSYLLGPRLGVGGMAAAYEALKQGPGGFEQRVCLKRVLPVYRDDPDFRRLFMREATIAASLRHSNIVGVIDFGEVSGEPYLALELIDGVDLRTLVRAQEGRRLAVDEVLLIGIEITRALEYAHNLSHAGGTGVLHRDISPSNVLVSTSGEIKLGDFGIAKLMGSAGATASAAVRGKLSYLAPETAEGDNVDARADIFALGVMLYELCHGHRPFDGSNDSQTFAAIQSGEPKPWQLEAGPAGLEALVTSMIARSPEARPSSAEELLEALTTVRKALSDYGDIGPRRAVGARVRKLEAERGTGEEEHGTAAVDIEQPSDDNGESAAPAAVLQRAGPDDPTKTQLGTATAETVEADGAATKNVASKRADSPDDTHERATQLLDSKTASLPAAHKWLWQAVVVSAIAFAALLLSLTGEIGSRESQPAASSVSAADPIASETPLDMSKKGSGRDPIEPKLETSKSKTSKPKTSDETQTARDAGTRDASASDAGTSGARATQKPVPTEGRVHVTVVPWGNIWIDGARRGRAPRWLTLSPGVHRVTGGRSGAEKTRSVRVRAGKSRRVLIDLGAP